jgi:hypothetical protein
VTSHGRGFGRNVDDGEDWRAIQGHGQTDGSHRTTPCRTATFVSPMAAAVQARLRGKIAQCASRNCTVLQAQSVPLVRSVPCPFSMTSATPSSASPSA